MVLYHAQRGAKQGRPGYLLWSILDGQAALRIPWRDLLTDGKKDSIRLETIRIGMIEFERRLAEHPGGDEALPPLPTPHARVVELDTAAFYAELARRVEEYKAEEARRVAEGAREVARRYDPRRATE